MVEPQYLGRSGPCAECGRVVTVPLPADKAAVKGQPPPARYPKSGRGRWPLFTAIFFLTALGIVVIAVVIFGVVVPASQTQLIQTQTAASARNLKKIARALRDYQKLYGSYPPSHTVDEFNQPMHSWRVLILPQLGRRDLYQKYDFSKSWDSPNNLRLLPQMPPEFASPDDPTSGLTGATNYFAIRGPNTMFRAARGIKQDQIQDGIANTLMLIEVDNSVVSWTQPIDYAADRQTLSDGTSAQNQRRVDGILVATADGQVHLLPSTLSDQTRKSLISASGGEPLGIKDFEVPIESD